jgi:hypothetical protein
MRIFKGEKMRLVFLFAALFYLGCALKQADNAKISTAFALRTADGAAISLADYDDYNPYLVRLSDGYLIAAFASDRTCGSCTIGKHHIFITKSITPYNEDGVLPFFNAPQPMTVSSAEQAWDAAISFAMTKSSGGVRIYVNNSSGDIVYADVTSGAVNTTALTAINNTLWASLKIVGIAVSGTSLFARSTTNGQVYLLNPDSSDATLNPMNSSQGSSSLIQINPQFVQRQDAFFTVQGNQVQTSSYQSMGGPVTALGISLANAHVQVRNLSVLYSGNRGGELVLLSAIPEGNSKQEMYIVEGVTPSLLWDQTFPKPGEQMFNPGSGNGSFTTFQAANFVLGSGNFTTKGSTGTFDIVDMDAQMGTFYLSQKTGSKLHVFNLMPNINNAPASYIMTGFNGAIAVDGPLMIRTNNTTAAADLAFFAPMPMAPGAFPAPSFGQGSTGATCTQSEFANTNEQLEVSAGKLLLPDNTNNRLLIWNPMPVNGTQFPNLVLGQPNFTSCTAGAVGQTSLKTPGKPWTNGQKLVVADAGYHRVLIWNSFPSSNGQAADIVLGQPNFTTGAANSGGPSASSLSAPAAVSSDGVRLAVLDKGNNRVLIWNTFPTTNNQPANIVLGQNDFTHVTANDDNQDNVDDNASNPASGRVFKSPSSILMTPNALLVADFAHERVLIFLNQ